MPDNPAGDVAGDTSGLWKVVVYKRRGEYIENEELIETPGEDLTHQEATRLCDELNEGFGRP